MKNAYRTCGLTKKSELSTDAGAGVFFKALDFCSARPVVRSGDSSNILEEFLRAGEFFVAHNVVRRKGRVRIFEGTGSVAQAEDVLGFIRSKIAAEDLRSLLICPVSIDEPSAVLLVSEDVFFLVCA